MRRYAMALLRGLTWAAYGCAIVLTVVAGLLVPVGLILVLGGWGALAAGIVGCWIFAGAVDYLKENP